VVATGDDSGSAAEVAGLPLAGPLITIDNN